MQFAQSRLRHKKVKCRFHLHDIAQQNLDIVCSAPKSRLI